VTDEGGTNAAALPAIRDRHSDLGARGIRGTADVTGDPDPFSRRDVLGTESFMIKVISSGEEVQLPVREDDRRSRPGWP
jgi:hypothetical protein